jgi:FMN reductase
LNDERLRVVGIGGTLREGSTGLGALRRSLGAAQAAGVETELLDLRELNLPMYEPGRPLEEYGPGVVLHASAQ